MITVSIHYENMIIMYLIIKLQNKVKLDRIRELDKSTVTLIDFNILY